jgi:hypothetical protein
LVSAPTSAQADIADSEALVVVSRARFVAGLLRQRWTAKHSYGPNVVQRVMLRDDVCALLAGVCNMTDGDIDALLSFMVAVGLLLRIDGRHVRGWKFPVPPQVRRVRTAESLRERVCVCCAGARDRRRRECVGAQVVASTAASANCQCRA